MYYKYHLPVDKSEHIFFSELIIQAWFTPVTYIMEVTKLVHG